MSIDQLSDKLIFEIMTHLDYESFLQASTVCVQWNRVIEENIDFFSSFFADGEDEEEEVEMEPPRPTKEDEEEEQALVVKQILSYRPNQYQELLGVSAEADEAEIRAQYKKLALMVHPDKNKAEGAGQAFQTVKKAFDVMMSGFDPDDEDTCQVDCPDPSCPAVVYLPSRQYNGVLKGSDIALCRVCKQKFGRVFCSHCFAAWTMILNPQLEGSVAQCSACHRQFAILFPQPAKRPPPTAPKKVMKKRKKNWWESPAV